MPDMPPSPDESRSSRQHIPAKEAMGQSEVFLDFKERLSRVAGIDRQVVHVRPDTPVHSLLHEACHIVCMDAARRAAGGSDAGGCDTEECAVCFLQLILAQYLPGVGARQLAEDMDACAWLQRHGLITASVRPSFRLRR